MPSLKHVHKYIRVSPKSKTFYMCAHPECSHREYKVFLRGKVAVCNHCDGEFILDHYALLLSKPICMKCRDTKDSRVNLKIKDLNTINILEKLK